MTTRDRRSSCQPAHHRPAARQPHQVRPRHHAQGQGAQRRPRPPADAHLGHVPQVPRRHGAGARGRGGCSRASNSGPLIEPPYRWRDWAAKDGTASPATDCSSPSSTTTKRSGPTAARARACSPTCAACRARRTATARDVIATVFRGIVNRMDQRLPAARRDQQGQRHPLQQHPRRFTRSAVSTSRCCREMRDAAGDSGEFYTPRPVVRFMVEVHRPAARRDGARPRLRHRRLPGRGVRASGEAVRDGRGPRTLQDEQLYGGEAKPLPYLLCADEPAAARPGVAADRPAATPALQADARSATRDRVDVILTNPPFGGEEETRHPEQLPGRQADSETALLFLQLIMRKLRRQAAAAARAAGRRRRAERHALRRRRLRPDQGGTARRSSTCTPSSACPTASSRPTPASRRTCSSSTAPARRRRSGTTSSRCPKAAAVHQDAAAPVRGVRRCLSGGATERERTRLEGPGRRRQETTATTSTSATPTARTTLHTGRRLSLSRT